MSVLTMDLKAYSYIHEGLKKAAYNNEVNQFYSNSISYYFKDKDIDKESKRLVKSWIDLNEKSFDFKYKEETKTPLSEFYREYSHESGKLSATQLFKFITCLTYNIEMYWEATKQEKQDYELLKKWELDIVYSIVASTEEYKAAQWSEYKAPVKPQTDIFNQLAEAIRL